MALKIGDFVDPVDITLVGPLSTPMPQRWYLLRVHPNKEARVGDVFRRMGICAYLPTFPRTIHVTRKVHRRIETPLFPGLLFVPDFEAEIDRLKRVDGVMSFLHFGEHAAWLSPLLVRDVRLMCDLLRLPPIKRACRFSQGQAVRVVDGVLSGYVGRIDRLDPRGRISVLIDAVKRGVKVQLTEAQIEPA